VKIRFSHSVLHVVCVFTVTIYTTCIRSFFLENGLTFYENYFTGEKGLKKKRFLNIKMNLLPVDY